MKKRKICIIITARPSYSRVKSVMLELKKIKSIELQVILTSSALLEKFGSVQHVIEKDGFKINNKILTVIEGSDKVSMGKTTGLNIIELTSCLNNLKPDIVVTIADRYETIANAISASYLSIPVAHIQGGEITGSIDERVRHAVTKLSDIHIVSTKKAYKIVKQLGENKKKIFNTGCPSLDLAKSIELKPIKTINSLKLGVGDKTNLDDEFIIALFHPDTNDFISIKKQSEIFINSLIDLNKKVLLFWPNIDSGSDLISQNIRKKREKGELTNFKLIKNVSPEIFLSLLIKSSCIVGNSSVGIRESSFLGVPCVNIGKRQENREKDLNVVDVNFDAKKIKFAILNQIKKGKLKKSKLYGDGNSGRKIAKILSKIQLGKINKYNFFNN